LSCYSPHDLLDPPRTRVSCRDLRAIRLTVGWFSAFPRCPFLGGNSTKATSGINGALTRTQARLGIDDSADKFENDILKGAAGVGHTDPPAHTVPLAKVTSLAPPSKSLLLLT
jgi:hypothetical protein